MANLLFFVKEPTPPGPEWHEFSGATYWSATSWDGTGWSVGGTKTLTPVGGWQAGLRPTKVRITHNDSQAGTYTGFSFFNSSNVEIGVAEFTNYWDDSEGWPKTEERDILDGPFYGYSGGYPPPLGSPITLPEDFAYVKFWDSPYDAGLYSYLYGSIWLYY
jgi:hypothetical protein